MRATTDEYAFHQGLLGQENRIVSARLSEELYNQVVRRTLARSGFSVDPVLVEEAVGQAFLDYFEAPERYDPERASLSTYLVMVAYRSFQKALERENRRSQWQVLHSDVAQVSDNQSVDDNDTEKLINRLLALEVWPRIEAAFTDPDEREVLFLIIDGVRDTSVYAGVLDVLHLPLGEQIQYVNKIKNRIKKRLRRIGEKFNE